MIILNIFLKIIIVIILLSVIILLIPIKFDIKVTNNNIFSYDISINYFFNILKLNLKNKNMNLKVFNFNILRNKNIDKSKSSNSDNENMTPVYNNELNLEVKKDDKFLKKIINSYKAHKIKFFNKKNDIKNKKTNTIKKIKNNFSKITSKKNINTLKKIINKLLKCVKFDKFKLNSTIGFDNPYLTGCVLSLFSILYYKFGSDIIVKPFFNKNIFLAEGDFLGSVRLYNLFIIFLIIVSNKDFRMFLFSSKENV